MLSRKSQLEQSIREVTRSSVDQVIVSYLYTRYSDGNVSQPYLALF